MIIPGWRRGNQVNSRASNSILSVPVQPLRGRMNVFMKEKLTGLHLRTVLDRPKICIFTMLKKMNDWINNSCISPFHQQQQQAAVSLSLTNGLYRPAALNSQSGERLICYKTGEEVNEKHHWNTKSSTQMEKKLGKLTPKESLEDA